jgi:hypothetical protein
MQNSVPKALTVHLTDAAQCPACLSFNFLRHLPASRWRAEDGHTIIECATCRKQYAAQFEPRQAA